MKHTYGPGSIIVYTAFGGVTRRVVVDDREEDVKNGRPGFHGHMADDPAYTVWGYDAQITCVERA